MTGSAAGDPLYEVAVVGGGPAGSSAATHLARAGRSVVLCDAARFPRHKTCGEYVPPAAIESFRRLGALDAVLRLGPRRHVGMAVIAPGGAEVLGRYGDRETRGLALRRHDLDQALLENARRCGVTVREGAKVAAVLRRPGGIFEVRLAGSAGALRARALVGADGRNSVVARSLGLRRSERRHRRWAVMGHFLGVETPDDHGEMIVTPYGYCGINPLPEGLSNVCVVLDPRRGRPGLPGRGGLRHFFDDLIASHPRTQRRLRAAALAAGLWAVGPLACGVSSSVADGALLVGDAAGFFDPFTGEGIAMALRGAELAATALGEALEGGDLRAAALASYEARRRAAFGARLRLDRLLQALLGSRRLTDWVARRLRRDPALADLLAQVAGDTADASRVLCPGFVARLLLA